jgi:hypothetical protein
MEPVSFLTMALGYILKGAAQSKTAAAAKEELLSRFWNWVKPYFIPKVPELEQQPQHADTEAKTRQHLEELIKDNKSFHEELKQQVAGLQAANISHSKNAVAGSTIHGNVHIGDVTHTGSGAIIMGDKHETHNYLPPTDKR